MSNQQDKLKKRAKRKYLMFPVIAQLLELESPLHNSYISTLACSSSIQTLDGKIKSRYCKRMWCSVCAPIKTAIRMNGYKEVLHEMGDLQLTTLTMPNVTHDNIKSSIGIFRQQFRQFRNTFAKQGHKFRGVYNFECTYNRQTRTYHPHIHIIHECIPMFEKTEEEHSGKFLYNDMGEEQPEYKNALTQYWCNHCPDVSAKAQDTRICYDLIEGFKYSSKSIFKIKVNGQNQPLIPVVELDLLYQQLAGVRCFQSFGIRRIAIDEDQAMDQLSAYNTEKPDGSYSWNNKRADWVLLHDSNIALSDFIPNKNQSSYFKKLSVNEFYKPPNEKFENVIFKPRGQKIQLTVPAFNPKHYEHEKYNGEWN